MEKEEYTDITGIHSFLTFNSRFFHYLFVLRWLLGMQLCIVLGCGLLFAHFETLAWHQGIYFSLVTSTSVGYGDITPQTGLGQVISVLLALVGVVFFGQVVALATHAFSVTLDEFKKPA